MQLTPLFLTFILTTIHLVGERYSYYIERMHLDFLSFGAGVFMTFLFMEALPQLITGMSIIGYNVFLLALIGFTLYHISEKYLYQHMKTKDALINDLDKLHVLGFIMNHFLIGFSLVLMFEVPQGPPWLGYFVFLPFVLHTLASSISLRHIHEYYRSGRTEKVLLACSPVFGAVAASVLRLQHAHFYIALCIAFGALLYIVIRDIIPKEEKGNPLYFMLGMTLSLAIVALTRL
ncbi:MAG: hypothetical protein JW834_04615 [Candidatus Diapherotrites archaeon]|nr:hypothetical protein [Candidatus Diapherotrites archaeon]